MRPRSRILDSTDGVSSMKTMSALAIGLVIGLAVGLAFRPHGSEEAEILRALRDELQAADNGLDALGVSAHIHRAAGRGIAFTSDVINPQPLCRLPVLNKACRWLDTPARRLREDADDMEHLLCVVSAVREHAAMSEFNAAMAECDR